ncbi:MAG: hypothetical protein Kow0075_14530 [Salibacteraceae bacterium]
MGNKIHTDSNQVIDIQYVTHNKYSGMSLDHSCVKLKNMETRKQETNKTYYRQALVGTLIAIGVMAVVWEVKSQSPKISEPSYSSSYNLAFGVRAGGTSGITVKYFTSSSSALEAIVGFGPNYFGITGLYEIYVPAFNVSGLNWYYGGGGHAVVFNSKKPWFELPGNYYTANAVGLGVDGIVGLEYKIPPIPIAVSIDLKPLINVTTTGNIGWSIDPGLGVKFTL